MFVRQLTLAFRLIHEAATAGWKRIAWYIFQAAETSSETAVAGTSLVVVPTAAIETTFYLASCLLAKWTEQEDKFNFQIFDWPSMKDVIELRQPNRLDLLPSTRFSISVL